MINYWNMAISVAAPLVGFVSIGVLRRWNKQVERIRALENNRATVKELKVVADRLRVLEQGEASRDAVIQGISVDFEHQVSAVDERARLVAKHISDTVSDGVVKLDSEVRSMQDKIEVMREHSMQAADRGAHLLGAAADSLAELKAAEKFAKLKDERDDKRFALIEQRLQEQNSGRAEIREILRKLDQQFGSGVNKE